MFIDSSVSLTLWINCQPLSYFSIVSTFFLTSLNKNSFPPKEVDELLQADDGILVATCISENDQDIVADLLMKQNPKTIATTAMKMTRRVQNPLFQLKML